jgi:hypothetical protein
MESTHNIFYCRIVDVGCLVGEVMKKGWNAKDKTTVPVSDTDYAHAVEKWMGHITQAQSLPSRFTVHWTPPHNYGGVFVMDAVFMDSIMREVGIIKAELEAAVILMAEGYSMEDAVEEVRRQKEQLVLEGRLPSS